VKEMKEMKDGSKGRAEVKEGRKGSEVGERRK
jgi:hypothetical protein